MHLGDITRWLRGNGLEIVLYVVGAVLIGRLIHWLAGHYVGRLERRRAAAIESVADDLRQMRTLTQAAEWATTGLVYFVAMLLVVARFQLPLTSLVAPATAIGAAIGFGSQRVVQDLLAGFFLFSERQYVYGDLVQISSVGATDGISGTVEELTLRTTKLRTVRGELVTIPNGQVQQVINKSRDWARVIVDMPIPIDEDLDVAMDVLRRELVQITTDPEWSDALLEPPVVAGVESLQAGLAQLRVSARTVPSKQTAVARELRRRIALALRDAGIASAVPQ
jgi:small-conductance mechanosensitive channel